MQARSDWEEVFKEMKGTNLHPRLLYLAKLSFRIKGQQKSFRDKKKLKKFITEENQDGGIGRHTVPTHTTKRRTTTT